MNDTTNPSTRDQTVGDREALLILANLLLHFTGHTIRVRGIDTATNFLMRSFAGKPILYVKFVRDNLGWSLLDSKNFVARNMAPALDPIFQDAAEDINHGLHASTIGL